MLDFHVCSGGTKEYETQLTLPLIKIVPRAFLTTNMTLYIK